MFYTFPSKTYPTWYIDFITSWGVELDENYFFHPLKVSKILIFASFHN